MTEKERLFRGVAIRRRRQEITLLQRLGRRVKPAMTHALSVYMSGPGPGAPHSADKLDDVGPGGVAEAHA